MGHAYQHGPRRHTHPASLLGPCRSNYHTQLAEMSIDETLDRIAQLAGVFFLLYCRVLFPEFPKLIGGGFFSRNFCVFHVFMFLVKIKFPDIFPSAKFFTNCDRTPPYLETNFQQFQKLEILKNKTLR